MSDKLLHGRDASILWANLTGITYERVSNILAVSQSSSLLQTELFQAIIARDPEVLAAIQQRARALLSATWEIEASKNLRGRLRNVYDALRKINWNNVVSHLAWFPYFGYSAVQVLYDDTGLPVQIEPIAHRAIDFRSGELYISTEQGWLKLTDIPNYQFKVFFALADLIDPTGVAIMRPVAYVWVLKHYVLRDWAIYSERLGDPPIIGKYTQGSVVVPDSTKSVAEYINEQLRELKNHATGAFPEGVNIQMLADDRFDASRAFQLLVDTIDRSMKRAILTSEATIQTGSEGRGARASDQIRANYGLDTVIEADARVVRDTLNEILTRVLQANGLSGDELYFKVTWIDELPTMRRIQAMALLKKAGFAFDEDEALKGVGFTPVKQTGGSNADIEQEGLE